MTSALPTRPFEAPARVNLIGEHTDYTGGLVLPMAIPFITTATISPSPDAFHHLRSDNFSHERILSTVDPSPKAGDWSDYPVGVLHELQALGIAPPPFALHLRGNVPLGAGLSSSASIEVATAMALLAHASATLPPQDIATLCQRAENNYVGSPCGIMDQFVVTAAVAGHALLLNTRDLTCESLPMNHGELANCRIVIANSGVATPLPAATTAFDAANWKPVKPSFLSAFPGCATWETQISTNSQVASRVCPQPATNAVVTSLQKIPVSGPHAKPCTPGMPGGSAHS